MRYQVKPGWCGAAAIQNALQIHGRRVGQERIAELAGTSVEEGTDEHGIIAALDALGFAPTEFTTDNLTSARRWVRSFASIAPLILCVDQLEHWVCVAGGCGERLYVFDSSRDPWNKRENGAWSISVASLLKRWRNSRRKAGDFGLYYGIAVLPRL